MTYMEHLPTPRPPRTKKADIFNLKDYEDIDNHAKKVSPALLQRGVKTVAAYLTKPAQNEVGKLRALFTWLASVDMKSLQKPANTSPPVDSVLASLLRIKAHKSNHAHLFLTLCREATIPCIKISGMAKNSRYQVGSEIDKPHLNTQWNAVVLDGQWRFVDMLWASTSVTRKPSVDWSAPETGQEEENRVLLPDKAEDEVDQESLLVYKVNEFFFLPDPEEFIYSHFPDDSKYQLLVKKITQKDFEMLPFLRERFFDMAVFLNDDSHLKCILETVDQDVYLQFGLDPARSEASEFRFLLHPAKSSKNKKALADTVDNAVTALKGNLNGAVSITKYPEELRLVLNLPVVNRYKLELYGREKGNPHCSTYGMLCDYIIDFQQASMTYLEVHFLFAVPADHARYLRRGGASNWLKKKEASLKVSDNRLIISLAMPTGPRNRKAFLSHFENRHQLVPSPIKSLIQILPPEFGLNEAKDIKSGHHMWNGDKVNIHFMSHVNGLVRTADGKVEIKLSLSSDTEIWYEFHEDQRTKAVPMDAVQLVTRNDGERKLLSFIVTVQKPMNYSLNIFTRNNAVLNRFFHVKTYRIEYELLIFV